LSFHSISPVLINLNSKQTSYIYFHHYENLWYSRVVMAPYSVTDEFQHFRGTYCLLLQG
jgi:hypothetical protein